MDREENPASIRCLTMLLRRLQDSSTVQLRLMPAALRFIPVELRMLKNAHDVATIRYGATKIQAGSATTTSRSPTNVHVYALVICNHAPHPRGIAGTLTFVLQIPAKSPALRGHPVGKTTALSPHSWLCFHCNAMFAYIRQTPGIYPVLQGQSKSKNMAKLRPPPLRGWGRGYK